MIYVFLADGFEEIEALAVVDILRRAELRVATVGVAGMNPCGAHGIAVQADMADTDIPIEDMEAVVLPGGMPGTRHLAQSPVVRRAVEYAAAHRLPIGAICAAPSVLGGYGLLSGVKATCYPGFEGQLTGALLSTDAVVTDGMVTTARGAGVAVDFALELVARLASPQLADEIRGAIQCR